MTVCEKFDKGIYDGTIGASVGFPDGSSIQLLSVKDTALVASKYSFITSFLKHYEGVRWYSLHTSSADTTVKWLNSQGVKTDSIRSGRAATELPKGWDWDDGGPQWRTLELNSKNPSAYLPGFMEYIGLPYREIQNEWNPYSSRKYYENDSNGVVGMSSLLIVVEDLKAA